MTGCACDIREEAVAHLSERFMGNVVTGGSCQYSCSRDAFLTTLILHCLITVSIGVLTSIRRWSQYTSSHIWECCHRGLLFWGNVQCTMYNHCTPDQRSTDVGSSTDWNKTELQMQYIMTGSFIVWQTQRQWQRNMVKTAIWQKPQYTNKQNMRISAGIFHFVDWGELKVFEWWEKLCYSQKCHQTMTFQKHSSCLVFVICVHLFFRVFAKSWKCQQPSPSPSDALHFQLAGTQTMVKHIIYYILLPVMG